MFRTGSMKWAILPVAAAFLGLAGCGKDVKRINGGGSSFVDPIVQKWSSVYKEQKGIEIDYKPTGSGNGIQQMIAKTLDFGCSDAPMTREQLETANHEGGDVVHIPVAIGAVAIVYNLPETGGKQITLSGKVLADIYRGVIKNWNHADIVALNKDVPLPNKEIVPVYRSDSSGTTKIFTEFMSKSNADFARDIGSSTEPKWPKIGTGQNGTNGVASFVKTNAYTIGYAEIYYAQQNAIAFAKIRNRQGADITPDADGAVGAAAAAALATPQTKEPYTLHELTFSLTDSDGSAAYPIVGITYAVFFKKLPEAKGKKLVEFLKWATSDGQKFAKELGYAPLPEELTKKIHARLDQVQYE